MESSPGNISEDFQLSELLQDEETDGGWESLDMTGAGPEELCAPEGRRLVLSGSEQGNFSGARVALRVQARSAAEGSPPC